MKIYELLLDVAGRYSKHPKVGYIIFFEKQRNR